MPRTPLSLAAALALAGACAGAPPGLGAGSGATGTASPVGTTLRLADGTPIGDVELRPGDGGTEVSVRLALPAGPTAVRGFHGFHVHANDDPANGEGCVADPGQPPATWFVPADGHLGSGSGDHGDHQGDMPPLLVDGAGRASATFTTDRLPGDRLDGRAVILHAGPDNLGNVPTGPAADQYIPNGPAATDKTRATGNAGDRLACGLLRPL
jgi:Cu-Zn family superoxide dismutase